MDVPKRASALVKAFAQPLDLPTNPLEWDDVILAAYNDFKKQHHKERMHRHYLERVEQGTAPRHRVVAELTPEEREARNARNQQYQVGTNARMRALHRHCKSLGIKVDIINKSKFSQLRELLQQHGLTADEIKAIEKAGVEEQVKKEAAKKAAEERAAKGEDLAEVDPSEMDRKTLSRYALKEFLERNPHITPVPKTINELREYSHHEFNKYTNFVCSLNPDKYKAAERRNEEKRRGTRKEYSKKRYAKMVARSRGEELVSEEGEPESKKFKTHDYAQYREDYKKTIAYRWRVVQDSARNRGLALELTKEDVTKMCQERCHYCGKDPQQLGTLFGVDRVDNSVGYTRKNSVTSCTVCNYAKRNYNVQDFIRGMCNVGAHTLDNQDWIYNYSFVEPDKDHKSGDYATYKDQAQRRGKEFHLSEEEFLQITSRSCYYCARDDKRMGVDRVDNDQGYTFDNCVACCALCNKMKGDWSVDVFQRQAVAIFTKWYSAGADPAAKLDCESQSTSESSIMDVSENEGSEAVSTKQLSKQAFSEFLANNPHLTPAPKTVKELRTRFPEAAGKYRAYVKSLNPDKYKAAEMRKEEKRRETHAAYAKKRRAENLDHVRAIEARYRASEKGKATSAAYEKTGRQELKESRAGHEL